MIPLNRSHHSSKMFDKVDFHVHICVCASSVICDFILLLDYVFKDCFVIRERTTPFDTFNEIVAHLLRLI